MTERIRTLSLMARGARAISGGRYRELPAVAAVIAGAIALAIGATLVRLSEVGPTASAMYRIGGSIPFFALWALIETDNRATHPSEIDIRWRLILLGAVFAGSIAQLHWSILFTTIANASLLANLAPVVVVILSKLAFGTKFHWMFLVGMAIGLLGTSITIGYRLDLSSNSMLGDGLGLSNALFYGMYLLGMNRLRQQVGAAFAMFWVSIGAFFVLAPLAIAFDEKMLPSTFFGVAVLISLALISHVAGQGLISFSLGRLSAPLGSVLLLAQPVLAAAFAWMILGEHLTAVEVAAGIGALLGLFVARLGSSRVEPISVK